MKIIQIVSWVSVGFAILLEPAFAGTTAAPGPIVGVGLPAFVLIGGAYWVARKFFGRKK
jgi:hypothetical protein